MPTYRIEGADATTGEDRLEMVDASNEAEADTKAIEKGMYISSTQAVEDIPSSEFPSSPKFTALSASGIVIAFITIALMVAAFLSATNSTTSQTSNIHPDPEREMRFYAAFKTSDISEIKQSLQDEPNILTPDPYSGDPFIVVAINFIDKFEGSSNEESKEAIKIAETLIDRFIAAGGDINAESGLALSNASSPRSIQLLLHKGASIEPSHIVYSASDREYAKLKLLIDAGGDPNASVFYGTTPLHYAASHNDALVIKYLLKQGAAINARDGKGYTPLKRARMSFHEDAERALLAAGATE